MGQIGWAYGSIVSRCTAAPNARCAFGAIVESVLSAGFVVRRRAPRSGTQG